MNTTINTEKRKGQTISISKYTPRAGDPPEKPWGLCLTPEGLSREVAEKPGDSFASVFPVGSVGHPLMPPPLFSGSLKN